MSNMTPERIAELRADVATRRLFGHLVVVECLDEIERLRVDLMRAEDFAHENETLAWVQIGKPEGTHLTSNTLRLVQDHDRLRAKLAECRAVLGELSHPRHVGEDTFCAICNGRQHRCEARMIVLTAPAGKSTGARGPICSRPSLLDRSCIV